MSVYQLRICSNWQIVRYKELYILFDNNNSATFESSSIANIGNYKRNRLASFSTQL